jgi:tetratricopeptide (TPR) repeat protein/predicted Ser/Thr protein kinase
MMSVSRDSTSADRTNLLGQAADEYTAELQAGRDPSLEGFAERYPEIEQSIRRVFPTLRALNQGSAEQAGDSGEVTPSQLGDYRIVAELGRGGMGVVYEAEQLSLNRTVALKTLPWAATLADTHLARFKNEARAAATLSHPHIVPVYSVGVDHGVHYYVMQLIRGRSLADWIEQPHHHAEAEKPSYYRDIARLALQAASALDHAHAHGIVHRDIKPANLLVDHLGQLWITDFGLALVEGAIGISRTGELLGTVRYMSPEQTRAHGWMIDHRTDIYSLGVTLYELIARRPVFLGTERLELIRQIADQDPVPPRKLEPRIPVELETIVLKSIEKNPADRYASAAELGEDLQNFLSCRPLNVKPATTWQRTMKWAQRHQHAVWTTGLAMTAMTVVLAVSTALVGLAYRDANQQRVRAETHLRLAREVIDDTYLKEIERAEYEPEMTHEQRDVLLRLVRFYEQLPQEDLRDPALMHDSCQVHQRLGDIHRSLGRHSQAVNSYLKAIQVATQLLHDEPDRAEFQRTLVLNLDGLGVAYRELHRFDDAVAAHRQALAVSQPLLERLTADLPTQRLATRQVHLALAYQDTQLRETALRTAIATLSALLQRFPGDVDLTNSLAVAQDHLGELLRATGRNHEAEAAFRRVLETHARLTAEQPRQWNARYQLATSQHHLAVLLADTGRIAEAEQFDRTAIEVLSTLSESFPEFVRYRRDLARTYDHLGCLLQREDKLAEAETTFRSAVELLSRLTDEAPEAPRFKADLAATLSNLGLVLNQAGRRDDSQSRFARAAEILTDLAKQFPADPDYRKSLLAARLNMSRFTSEDDRLSLCEQAINEMEQLASQFPERIEYAQDLIRYHSLCGNALQRLSRLEDAEQQYLKAIQIANRFAMANPEVIRHYESVNEFMVLGYLSSQLGKLKQAAEAHRLAIENCRILVEQFPHKAVYRSNLSSSLKRLGLVLAGQGSFDEARRCVEESRQIALRLSEEHPNEPKYLAKLDRRYLFLIRLYLHQAEYAQAEAAMRDHLRTLMALRTQHAVVSEPTTPPAYVHLQLANLFVELQPPKWADAEAEMRSATRLYADANDQVQRILIESQLAVFVSRQGRLQEADSLLQNVWQQTVDLDNNADVDDRLVLPCRWSVLERMDAVADAPPEILEDTFDRCCRVAANSSQADWLCACAVSLASLKQISPDHRRTLLSWVNRVLESQPDSASAWTAKGAVEYRCGDFAAAAESLDKAAALEKGLSVTNRLYQTMAHFHLGDHDEAHADFLVANEALMISRPLQLLSLRTLRDEAARLIQK